MTDKITLTITIDENNLNPVGYDQLGQYTIDWGDGTEEAQTYKEYGDHEYSEPGTYTIVFDFGEGRDLGNISDSSLFCNVPYDISFLVENSYTIYSLPSNVKTIKFETSNVPTVEDGGLDNLEDLTTIYVPSGSLSSFTSATNFPSTSDVEYVEFSDEEEEEESNNSSPVSTSTLYNHLKTLNKQWFYEKTEIDTDFIAKSNTSGLVKNDGTIDTNTYLTTHQDISGKANSADLATVATTGLYSDLNNIPETFAPSSHGHSATEVTDSSAYSNLETTANATQHSINTAIDAKIGSLLSVELLEVTPSLGTASADTMNKLYLIAEDTSETNDVYEIYVTVRTGSSPNYSYTWEKIDTTRIDLSGYALIDHVHGNISNDGKIGSNSDYFVTTTTNGLVTSQEMIGNIDVNGAIGSDADKVLVTTTDGVVTVSDWNTEIDSLILELIAEGTPVVVEHITNPKILILNADGSPVNQAYTVIISLHSDEEYQSSDVTKTMVSNSFGEIAITDNWTTDDGTPNGPYYNSEYYSFVKVNNETLSKVEYYYNDNFVKEFTTGYNDCIQIEFDGGGNYFLEDEGNAIYLYLDNGE